MDAKTIKSIMNDRDFSLAMESRDNNNKVISYYFVSEPVYHRRHKDVIMIPTYGCTVYQDSGDFQFTYAVPKSINKLETPKCGSLENEDHFYNICAKFESAVQALYQAFQ